MNSYLIRLLLNKDTLLNDFLFLNDVTSVFIVDLCFKVDSFFFSDLIKVTAHLLSHFGQSINPALDFTYLLFAACSHPFLFLNGFIYLEKLLHDDLVFFSYP